MNILYFLVMLIIICFYFIQNSQMIEHFHFEVSPERKLCMEQSVCQTVDSNGNCSTLNNPNLNSTNFPHPEILAIVVALVDVTPGLMGGMAISL